MRKRDIDIKDIEILNILQSDSSLSNVALADQIKLSPGPTLVRVQNLLTKKIILSVTATPNYTYLGYKTQLLVEVKILTGKASQFIKRVSECKNSTQCVQINRVGEDGVAANTYFLTIRGKNEANCKSALDFIFGNPSLAISYTVYVVTDLIKNTGIILDKEDCTQ